MKSAAPKPAAPKPAAPSFGAGIKAGSMLKKEEFSEFDLILSHLIEQGFGDDEALKLMVNMSEEKREEILENRRAARAAGGYKDDSKKQTDPSKDGFTGISGSIKDVMKQSAAMDKKKTRKEEDESLYQAYLSMMSEGEVDNVEYLNRYGGHPEVKSKKKKKTPFEKENPGHSDSKPTARRFTKADREEMSAAKKEIGAKVSAAWAKQNPKLAAKKQKTQKEETDSLYQAYLSMMSEEESDKRKDKHLERGGHAARTDYSKPPATGNTFGKKKPMSDEDRSAAMAKIVAKMKKQGGK